MRRENIESKRNMGPEDIVVRAVVNYFDTPRFKRFSIEKEYPIQIGSYRMRADVALIDKAKPPAAIVECKRSGYEGDGQDQLESYLNVTGTQLGVFANGTDPDAWRFYKNRGKGHFDEIDRSRFESQLNGNVIKRLGRFLQSLLPNPPEPDEPPRVPSDLPPVDPNPSHIIHIPGDPSVQNDNNTDLDPSLNSEPYYSEQNGFFWARAHRGLVSLLPQHIERIIYDMVQNNSYTNSYDAEKQSLEMEKEQLDTEQKTCQGKLYQKKQELGQVDREQARLDIEIGALPDKDAKTEPEVHRKGWSRFQWTPVVMMTLTLFFLIWYLFIFYASACDKAFFFDPIKQNNVGVSDLVNPFAIIEALTSDWVDYFVFLCPIIFLALALTLHYVWESSHWKAVGLGIAIFVLDLLLAIQISRNIYKGEGKIRDVPEETSQVETIPWLNLDTLLLIALVIFFGFGVALLTSVVYHYFLKLWKVKLNPTEEEMRQKMRQWEEGRVLRVEKESQRAVNAISQREMQADLHGLTEELSAITERSNQIQEMIEALLQRRNGRVIDRSQLRSQVNEFLVGWCHYVAHQGADDEMVAEINKAVETTIDRFYKTDRDACYLRAHQVQEAT